MYEDLIELVNSNKEMRIKIRIKNRFQFTGITECLIKKAGCEWANKSDALKTEVYAIYIGTYVPLNITYSGTHFDKELPGDEYFDRQDCTEYIVKETNSGGNNLINRYANIWD